MIVSMEPVEVFHYTYVTKWPRNLRIKSTSTNKVKLSTNSNLVKKLNSYGEVLMWFKTIVKLE